MDSATWDALDRIVDWLDHESRLPPGEEKLLRILKVTEEAGEAAQAVLGATGQNPRKGTTHTWTDVEHELCDVVFAALIALRTLTPDARTVFADRLAHVTTRPRQPAAPEQT
ncbi:MazG-like family protein [Kitasatospora sp. NPDC002040]|uniref:MazG-like family protein n=1 Tax=Kitasatospora sp. NPDC002040 TaxID=3154661 RepID=UPI0033329BD0